MICRDLVAPLLELLQFGAFGGTLRLIVFFEKPLDGLNAGVDGAERRAKFAQLEQRRGHGPRVHHRHVGAPLVELQAVALVPGDVKRPQMQWNRLQVRADDPLLAGFGDDAWVYFVHSYAAPMSEACIATCDYGGEVVAMVRRGNVRATQFHPEKSGESGLRLLANFVDLVRASTREVA